MFRIIIKNNQRRGQIIVAMIALMLLSLSLGITVAGGFIKNIRSQTNTDDLSKAGAGAEALLEQLLALPNSTLEGYIDGNNCGSACAWSVTDVTGENITASAVLSYAGNSTETFFSEIETTKVFQLNLKDYHSGSLVDICWDTPASIYASYVKENSGVISSDAYAYNAVNTSNPENNFQQATANHGHASCFSITADGTPQLVRLRPYYLNTAVYVIPQAGYAIPKQGVLIMVTGRSGDSTRIVSALKTTAVPPSIFDYAVYQKSPNEPLSNITL